MFDVVLQSTLFMDLQCNLVCSSLSFYVMLLQLIVSLCNPQISEALSKRRAPGGCRTHGFPPSLVLATLLSSQGFMRMSVPLLKVGVYSMLHNLFCLYFAEATVTCTHVSVQGGRRIQSSLTLCLIKADTPGAGAALIFCPCLPKVHTHSPTDKA